MEQYLVVWNGEIRGGDLGGTEAALDSVMEHLLSCPDLVDPTVSYSRSLGSVVIEVVVNANGPQDAGHNASFLVRSSLHAAGVGTPGWPSAEALTLAEAESQITFDVPSVEPLVEA